MTSDCITNCSTFVKWCDSTSRLNCCLINRELNCLLLLQAIFFAAPIIVGCFTFVTYVRTGGVLNPQKVFTVLTLFSIVQFSMTKVKYDVLTFTRFLSSFFCLFFANLRTSTANSDFYYLVSCIAIAHRYILCTRL
jgi:hypothetical protein